MTERSMLHPDMSHTGEIPADAGSSAQPLSISLDISGHRGGRSERGMVRRSMSVHAIIVSGIIHLALLTLVLSGGMVPSLMVRPTSAVTVYLAEGSQQRKSPVLSAGVHRKHTPAVTKPARDGGEREEPHPVLARPVPEIPAASENHEAEVMRNERKFVPVQEAVSGGAGPLAESTKATQDEPGSSEGSKGDGTYQVEFGAPDGPRFLKRVEPVYPPIARRLGKEGRILLSLFIDQTGSLISVDVLEKADYGFERAAVDAVRASRFLPAVRDGKGVPSRSKLAVKFVLYQE